MMTRTLSALALTVLALLLLGLPTVAGASRTPIPEYDYFPPTCDGPCMGSNDTCCDPFHDPDAGGGTGGSCAGLYCFTIPEGPEGQSSSSVCMSGGSEWDATHNECTENAGGYCTLNDPCSVN